MATLNAQFCSPAEQQLSAKPNAPLHCLTRNESIALAFVAQSGALSLFACGVTFALILRNVIYHVRRMPGQWRLIKSPMDVYLLSLFVSESVLSIGGFINGKWVREGKLRVGHWCTAQAVGLSVGSINVASITVAIAVHTFVIVWCNKGFRSIKAAWIATIIPWIFSIIYVAAINAVHPGVYRPAPYWCWIGKNFLVYRLFGGYLWMWASLLVSCLLYIPLFFWGRGNITIGDQFWNFQIHRRWDVEDPEGVRRRALKMIAYPLVYALQILPLSAARWIGFVQENHGDRKNHVPPMALLAVQVIYNLSGIVNVLLFLITRPGLLLFKKEIPCMDMQTGDGDTDSIEGRRRKIEHDSQSELERI